jgi:hypothetical protein
MKHRMVHGVVLLLFAVALVPTLNAQLDTKVRKADIPFAFYIGEQQFPAGEYLISWPGGVIHIQSMDGTLHASVMSFRVEARKTNERSVLRFNSYGRSVPYLSQIWIAGNDSGRELLKSKSEVEVAKNSSNRTYAMVRLGAAH